MQVISRLDGADEEVAGNFAKAETHDQFKIVLHVKQSFHLEYPNSLELHIYSDINSDPIESFEKGFQTDEVFRTRLDSYLHTSNET